MAPLRSRATNPATHAAQRTEAEAAVLAQVESELRAYRKHGTIEADVAEHTRRWARRFANPRRSFILPGDRIDPEVLRSFRRLQVFVGDNPAFDLRPIHPLNLLSPDRLAERALLHRCLRILESHGMDDLLRRYPSPETGRPWNFTHRGHTYTHRWFKQIYMLGLVRRVLADRLPTGLVGLDIGGAYGIFGSLLHCEFPGSHQVLVELPGPLLLASYFLRTHLPGCRIATVEQLADHRTITREVLQGYDFVLMPPQLYERIAPGSIDLVSSFAALGELKRGFFDFYVSAPAFRTARFLVTANPFVSAEMFDDSDVTVLDYPLWDPGRRLHFQTSPVFFERYGRIRWRPFRQYRRFPPFFEFVGAPSVRGAAGDAAAPEAT